MSTAGRARGFVVIAVAYGVAGLVALVTAALVPSRDPIQVAFWADVAATVAIFAFSFAFDNSSFYDAYWSVAPIAIALYWLAALDPQQAPLARQVLVSGLVGAWGLRLTWNWARGWEGLSHEDWRYVDKRRQTGRLYWLVSFTGLHMMPTLLVFAGCLPLYWALASGSRPLGVLDAAAVLVTAGAILLEATADRQLLRFRRSGPKPGAILETGVWAGCRHPNYLGEIGFWWGVYLFGLAASPDAWWTGVGALSITLLFRFASLGLIDDRMLERRPDYKRRMETTPALIPRFGRGAG